MTNTPERFKRYYIIFSIFILAFCALLVIVESINGKLWTNDFVVYYGAVNDFFSQQNPYDAVYGLDTGHFKYPPFTLYLFSFYALIPFKIAQGIHLFLLCISLMSSMYLWHKMFMQFFVQQISGSYKWILYVAFLFIAIHVVRELHLGNINLLLLFLFTLGVYFYNEGRFRFTILYFSLLVILKPMAIFIFIPCLFYKQWRIILGGMFFGLIFFLFPIINLGWSGNLGIWSDWLDSIIEHGDTLISENTMSYLFRYYFDFNFEWLFSIIGLVAIVGFLFYDRFVRHNNERALIFWSLILLAYIPNFFVTDTEHFLLSLPLIISLLFGTRVRPNIYKISFVILVFLMFSLNSNDLLGKEFSSQVHAHGILGLGNLILITGSIFIYFKEKLWNYSIGGEAEI